MMSLMHADGSSLLNTQHAYMYFSCLLNQVMCLAEDEMKIRTRLVDIYGTGYLNPPYAYPYPCS